MTQPEPLSHLSQEQLIWIGTYADRLRARRPGRFALPDQGHAAEEIARAAWERGESARRSAEQAADHWLDNNPG